MEIILILLSIFLVVIGVFIIVKDKLDKGKESLNAVVVACQKAQTAVENSNRNLYDITLEIDGKYGTVTNTIQEERLFKVGTRCRVYYDMQNGKTEFAREYRESVSLGGILLIMFGLVFGSAALAEIYMPQGTESTNKFGMLFAFGVAILFAMIGIYGGIIQPVKRKREMEFCQVVSGRVVDVITRTRRKDGRTYTMYTPVYGFYYDGNEHTLTSSMSSNSSKRGTIGRNVSIVINEKTGKLYCREDESRGFFLIFAIAGVVIAMMVLAESGLL